MKTCSRPSSACGLEYALLTYRRFFQSVNFSNLPRLLDVHHALTKLFEDLTGLEKRSLASKYLHFHFPRLFFLYDNRAIEAVSMLSQIAGPARRGNGKFDNEYRKFAGKCLRIRDHIKKQYKVVLTPRQLDNLLLNIYSVK